MTEKTTKRLLIVFVVLSVVLFASAIFIRSKYLDEINDLNEIISEEVQQELNLVLKFAEFIEPKLSEEGQEALDIIIDYINENPNVLAGTNPTIPSEVADAIEVVRDELNELKINWGESEDDSPDAVAGEQRIITGTLEEYSGDNQFGATYAITDNETSITYYFLFGESTVTMIESEGLVGQEVTVTIEMTGEGQQFVVVSGPTLSEEEMLEDEEV